VQACKGTERRKIPPSFEAAEKKDNLNCTAHAVRNVTGAKKTPPRENQRVTEGSRQVPLL
jgi:hypothetical protein